MAALFSRDVNPLPPSGCARAVAAAPAPAASVRERSAAAAPCATSNTHLQLKALTGEVACVCADGLTARFRIRRALAEGGFGVVYVGEHVSGRPELAPGAQLVLKYDADVKAGAAGADAALLPGARASGPLALDSLRSCVLREAHAYALLLDGAGPAPAGAPVPSFCIPFVSQCLAGSPLAQPCHGCTRAYTERDAFGLALPRLGRTLVDISRQRRLTQAQALGLAAKMITALQFVHERGLLHLDVKPHNFCVESDDVPLEDAKLCIIDFGLALEVSSEVKRSSAAATADEAAASCGAAATDDSYFYGTPAYASHRAIELQPLSYRDDLESVVYTAAELASDTPLPWTGRTVGESCCSDEWSDDGVSYDTGDWASHSFATVQACRKTADYVAFAEALPAPLRRLWHAVQALKFGEVPRYDELRALLAPEQTAVRKRARAPEEEVEPQQPQPQLARPAESALVAAGPQEPNGKRLRAAVVADMLREE